MRKQTIILVLAALLLWSLAGLSGCSVDEPSSPVIAVGTSAFRVARPVVSIGNSLTAGFQNGGLVVTGQLASVPQVLTKLVGGPAIDAKTIEGAVHPVYLQLPLVGVNDPDQQQTGIGSEAGLSALYVDGATGEITRDPLTVDPSTLLLNATYPLPYDNLGVPGGTTLDTYSARDAASSQTGINAYFDLILRNSALPPYNTTQLSQLEAHFTRETIVGVDSSTGAPIYAVSIPKIITVWIGNNDVLGGVLTGNPQVGVNVTPSSVWAGMYTGILDQIAAFAPYAQIALANLQSTLPYLTTVPLGADPTHPWTTDESDVKYILLPAASELNPPLGPDYLAGGSASIPAEYTLTQTEWDAVEAQITAYNQIIQDEATRRGWALVDVDARMLALPRDPMNPSTYASLNGVFPWLDLTGDGVPEQNVNSAFSLDGIHPSEKGYAAIAEWFAMALNATYGTSYSQDAGVDGIQNVAGFEQVLAAPKRRTATGGVLGISFTSSGAAGLRATVRMMGAGG
jgi:hypothetical protein